MFPLLLGAALLAGLGFLVWHDNNRKIRLVNGKQYAIAFRTSGPGFDFSMFPGFCEFSQPTVTEIRQPSRIQAPILIGYEVQFTAQWCAANTVWEVPEGIAVAEL